MSNDIATTLFEGKKYFLVQRVPSRNHWIELLKAHGGRYVKLEQQADFIVADHARKDAPPGSLSWKFIQDSVGKGELQDPAAYPAGTCIPSGKVAQTKTTGKLSRTSFTVEDDRQLWDWVTEAEKRGVSISGNKLYEELAAINPRHTGHSWRDRWLKNLALRERRKPDHPSPQPKSTIRDPAPSPQNVGRRHVPASSSSESNPSPTVATTNARAEPINSGSILNQGRPSLSLNEQERETSSSRQSSPYDFTKEMQEPLSEMSFTNEDEELLLSMYKEIVDIDPKMATKAWTAFGKAYPQHSAEEWKFFWDEVVRPAKEGLKSEKAKKSKAIGPSLIEDKLAIELSDETQSQETEQEPQTATSQNGNKEWLGELDLWECRKISEHLIAFLGAHESPVHFAVKEAICGDQILMYDICRAITSAFDEGAKVQRPRRWEEVARLIGIRPSPLRTKVLKEKFSHVVERFFEFKEFIAHLKSIQQSEADEETDEPDYDDVPNSPIALSREENLGKRRHIQTDDESSYESYKIPTQDSFNGTLNINKRQRINKGKGKEPEIPSTPEDLYRPRPKRTAYQSFAQDPETQNFHFPQATQDEECLYNYSQADSPSNQIRDEEYRATQRSPEPDSESSGGYRRDTRVKLDRYMALGYTEEIVREALGATTSNSQHAAIVMEELMQGKGIPDNLGGVWTAEDDLALGEAGGMERMTEKHGSDNVEERVIWLEAIEALDKGGELR